MADLLILVSMGHTKVEPTRSLETEQECQEGGIPATHSLKL